MYFLKASDRQRPMTCICCSDIPIAAADVAAPIRKQWPAKADWSTPAAASTFFHFGYELWLGEGLARFSEEERTRPSTMGCHIRDYGRHGATLIVGPAHVNIDAFAKLITFQQLQVYLKRRWGLGIVHCDIPPCDTQWAVCGLVH